MLRKLLRTLGLSQQSADDVVNFIVDLLAGERKSGNDKSAPEFPYHLRDHFLSPAELNFYSVLRTVINGRATICTKVGLQDIFYVKSVNFKIICPDILLSICPRSVASVLYLRFTNVAVQCRF